MPSGRCTDHDLDCIQVHRSVIGCKSSIGTLTGVAQAFPGLGKHINSLEKNGKFPKRVRLGPNTIGWLVVEVDALVASLIAARDEAAPADAAA